MICRRLPSLRQPISGDRTLIVKDEIEEGTVHVQPAVVMYEAQFLELIHEETDTGARRADHLGERFLTDLWNNRLRLAFFPKMGH